MDKEQGQKKQISSTRLIIGLILFVGSLILLFFLRGPEDRWMCENGEWVQHGHPSADKPVKECP